MIAPTATLDEALPKDNPVQRKRAQLGELAAKARPIRAKYDAAGSGTEYARIWENTDALDADSANSRLVRQTLVQRSRYEIANNGYASGIAKTYATDLIGMGPQLRMQSGSEGFNRMVERAWMAWTKEIKFRRKLWCMAHAKHSDGESFGVIRQNRRLRNPVKMDIVLHETEQCQTPYSYYGRENYIDGVKFDSFGNPEWYDFLRYHPGSTNESEWSFEAEQVPARYVLHWFKVLRPGQHRGIPETVSTLNLGAAARRWREAVLAAAENIADYSLFLKTMFEPDEMDSVDPMSTLEIEKRMMVALPAGYEAFQPRAEQPVATHAEFSKALVSEQARPHSMPLNKAACDSSNYNYASGRLDHQTYYGSLDVDRLDCNDDVLDPLFREWFEMAVTVYGWVGGNAGVLNDAAMNHTWDWPKHQVADIVSEETAADKRLKNGKSCLAAELTANGQDPEDQLAKQAESNGLDIETQRHMNYLANLPQHMVQYAAAAIGIETPQQEQTDDPPEESETDDESED